MQQLIWCVIFCSVALTDILVANQCLKENTKKGNALGRCLWCAFAVTLFYLMSILTKDDFFVSLSSSIYFCIIDYMLLHLLGFFFEILEFDEHVRDGHYRIFRIFSILTLADTVNLLLNPFTNHAISFVRAEDELRQVARYVFEPHFCYHLHLALCYLILAYGFAILIYRMRQVPALYRGIYLRVIGCVLTVVLLNALFLLHFIKMNIDVSILCYSLLGYGVYISVFVYGNRDVLHIVRQTILEYAGQALFLFDYKDRLLSVNRSGETLLLEMGLADQNPDLSMLVHQIGAEEFLTKGQGKRRFYWKSKEKVSYICEFQERKDRQGLVIARSLTFTNNTLGVDPLTGYQTEAYFSVHSQELSSQRNGSVGVAVCDLNRLSLLNNVVGHGRGDQAIALQAEILRRHLPARSEFVRLQDAKLCAVCYGLTQQEIKDFLTEAEKELENVQDFALRLKMDFAICMLEENGNVVDAVEQALSILKTRKLLDQESDHSSVIDSLQQMLIECDPETESHVRRTRILGDNLAYDIGLSDYERDQLSLLCLFHDIGKVGIPQHILNKPGPLDEEEILIMQQHVQKGYRIARATAGLEIVADAILHHHEHWDGKGYPDGLMQESIPLLSRIIGIVDAYDAMVTDRVYRKGVSREAACEELLRCAGTQFDPYIAEAFVRMVNGSSVENVERETDGQNTDLREPAPAKARLVNPVRFSQYVLNADMQIQHVDEKFEELTGYTIYDVMQRKLTQDDLLFDDDREAYWKIVRETGGGVNIAYLEHRVRRKDGTGRYVYCTGIPFKNKHGDRLSKIIVTDITDSISMQQQIGVARNRAMMSLRRLEESIQLDPMTGLLNQAAFRRNCERELMDETHHFVLMMMDLDDFKGYNDTFGHPKGDELLTALAQSLLDAVRQSDLIGRMGGDEFACLLKFGNDISLADRRRRVREIWMRINDNLQKMEHSTTISIGAVCDAPAHVAFRELYDMVDRELYRAKREGKNQLSIAEEREA